MRFLIIARPYSIAVAARAAKKREPSRRLKRPAAGGIERIARIRANPPEFEASRGAKQR